MTGIGLLSRAFPRSSAPTMAALDMEALRICAGMEHIKARGNLDGFSAGRSERLALMSTAGRQGLVVWDKRHSRYELTNLGERRLGSLRTLVSGPLRADRPVGQAPDRSRMKSGLIGVVAGAAACTGLIVWFPSDLSKPPSALEAAAPPLSAAEEVASREQPALPEKPSTPARGPGTDVQAGQLARSSSVDTLGQPQMPAAVADKAVVKKRSDAQQSRKVAHNQRKTGRRARPADPDEAAIAPSYGYGPPLTMSDRQWGPERRPPLGFAEDDPRNTGRAPQRSSPPSWFFRW
jgi:hypothetical protein